MPSNHYLRFVIFGIASLPYVVTQAATFTVGPGGTHGSIAAAVTTASGTPGSEHEIRLRAQELTEPVDITYSVNKSIIITGGWDATYATKFNSPLATRIVIPAGVGGRPLRLDVSNGSLAFSNVTLEGGAGLVSGGGVELRASNHANLVLSDCVVRYNRIRSTASASGAGVLALAAGTSRLRLVRCHISDNVADGGDGTSGAGIHASAYDASAMQIDDNRILRNRILTSQPDLPNMQAAGLQIYAGDGASVSVNRNRVMNNSIDTSHSTSPVHGAHLSAEGTSTLLARSNIFRNNAVSGWAARGAHVSITAQHTAALLLGDSEISGGRGSLVALEMLIFGNTASLDAVNLTIADNAGRGVIIQQPVGPAPGLSSLSNSIIDGNSIEGIVAPAWIALDHNLIDVDPHFVARASNTDNYRLAADSPAIDAGSPTPLPGLGASDADNGPRVVGAAPDIGAYEYRTVSVFGDSFELPAP